MIRTQGKSSVPAHVIFLTEFFHLQTLHPVVRIYKTRKLELLYPKVIGM